jgi:hypothetical protein
MYIRGSNQIQMTDHQDILRYLHLNQLMLDLHFINVNNGNFKCMSFIIMKVNI